MSTQSGAGSTTAFKNQFRLKFVSFNLEILKKLDGQIGNLGHFIYICYICLQVAQKQTVNFTMPTLVTKYFQGHSIKSRLLDRIHQSVQTLNIHGSKIYLFTCNCMADGL